MLPPILHRDPGDETEGATEYREVPCPRDTRHVAVQDDSGLVYCAPCSRRWGKDEGTFSRHPLARAA